MEYWKKQKVLKELNISDKHLKRLREQGAPPPVKFKGYDIKSLCEWIVAKPQKRQDRTKIREYAHNILTRFLKKNPPPEVEKEDNQEEQLTKKRRKNKIEPGLLNALERARLAEVDAYKAHLNFKNKSGIVNAAFIKTWQTTLDVLRNCEKDFTKVLESRRELVQMKEVVDFLEPMIEQVKVMLLNLPAQLAPSLEGMQWQDIEKKLDQEIRHVLGKFTNFS